MSANPEKDLKDSGNIQMSKTLNQYNKVAASCRKIFHEKLKDYGPSWRVFRPKSITDQIFIKASRIRTLEELKEQFVEEGILEEFLAIVNYGIIGLIQLESEIAMTPDLEHHHAMELYDLKMNEVRALMIAKNHDYGEAWRQMRITSLTDLILVKLNRTKEIEENDGKTLVSEGIASNYMDIINYAIFALIKLSESQNAPEQA